MGLVISHGGWAGPYGEFHLFRSALARAAGIPYLLLEGIYDPEAAVQAGWPPEVCALLPLDWVWFEQDPLALLLMHADDDGGLGPAECALLGLRLRALLPALGDWAIPARRLMRACFVAAAADESLTFG